MMIYHLVVFVLGLVLATAKADFTCLASDPSCITSFFTNNPRNLGSLLGGIAAGVQEVESVVVRNDVLGGGNSTSGKGNGTMATGKCATMTVLFARGTGELGNVGLLAGPPFFDAIANYMNGTGQLAVQGVDYPADVVGFLAGGSPSGTLSL